MNTLRLRKISEEDHYNVEYIAKKAFWNLNMPGCDEHYLVHRIWEEPTYVPEISLLAEIDGNAVGFILYTRCRVEAEAGNVEVLTFGPLCVVPEYQKMGVGKTLLLESMELAKEHGFIGILICGVPEYYPKFGFKTADQYGITMSDGSNFDAFMGYELQENGLSAHKGKFYEPDSLDCDIHDESYMKKVEEFDKKFPYMEKKVLPGQWR